MTFRFELYAANNDPRIMRILKGCWTDGIESGRGRMRVELERRTPYLIVRDVQLSWTLPRGDAIILNQHPKSFAGIAVVKGAGSMPRLKFDDTLGQ
jgi:hypothetical protein